MSRRSLGEGGSPSKLDARRSVFKGLFHEDPTRKLTEKEIEKIRLKAAKLKAHLEKVEK